MAPRPNSLLDMPVIEAWINQTLKESEFFAVRGALAQDRGTRNPLEDYAVDRFSLKSLGLSDPQIDSYYTSLYVNTIGFYSRIRELVDSHTTRSKLQQQTSTKHDSKGSLISALWKVYAILFEYSF